MQHDSSSSSNAQRWAEGAIDLMRTQLLDETGSFKQSSYDHEMLAQLCQTPDTSFPISETFAALDYLEDISAERIKSVSMSGCVVPLHLRKLYTDCRLLHSLLDLRDPASTSAEEDRWEHAIRRLDMSIIVAGAPGEGRLDLILDTIEFIQAERLPMSKVFQYPVSAPSVENSRSRHLHQISIDTLSPHSILRISPPSLAAFRKTLFTAPFILSGFICNWPALLDHPWNSPSYLRRIAGRGRVVPVEVGSDYRAEEWGQKIMPWEDFLRGIGMNIDSDPSVNSNQGRNSEAQNGHAEKQVLYLAQHSLLMQLPTLRSDIIVPDYVYASLPPPPTFPTYRPPGNDEQLVINAWLGPKGTVSPAHTDPYFNCYAQVVGRKTVWLAPPQNQDVMYPFENPHAPHASRTSSTNQNSTSNTQKIEPSLANTSRVDVFAQPDAAKFPLFESHVRPHATCAVLEPGDLLYIPAGYWHAMRSEDVSFSVSMWF